MNYYKIMKFADHLEGRIIEISKNININTLSHKICKAISLKFIKVLGRGDRGIALLCDNRKVVKLTSDKQELSFYLNTMNLNCKYFVKAHNIYKINSPHISECYAIVIDQLRTLNKPEKEMLVSCLITFYYYTEFFENQDHIYVDELKDWISKNYPNDQENCYKFLYEYSLVIGKVGEIGCNIYECHVDNIGYNSNGEMQCFDMTMKLTKFTLDEIKNLKVLNIW